MARRVSTYGRRKRCSLYHFKKEDVSLMRAEGCLLVSACFLPLLSPVPRFVYLDLSIPRISFVPSPLFSCLVSSHVAL